VNPRLSTRKAVKRGGVVHRAMAVSFLVTGLLPAGCDHSPSGGHMMGGGMMRSMSPGTSTQAPPEPQSDEARLFRHYCGQCHALPAPAAYAAREWPQVVARMKQHMVTQSKTMPDREQFQEIIDYLQRHAG